LSLATACLLFLLGGAAIANALLSSVLERVAEIGVRRAVGARRRHIAVQFLFEATLIAMAGAGAGMAGGLLLIAAAVHRGWDVAVPVAAVLAIPAIATVTALIAGTYPAMRAAAVEPIEALSRG
jgi:putative ABC transport system permease protein